MVELDLSHSVAQIILTFRNEQHKVSHLLSFILCLILSLDVWFLCLSDSTYFFLRESLNSILIFLNLLRLWVEFILRHKFLLNQSLVKFLGCSFGVKGFELGLNFFDLGHSLLNLLSCVIEDLVDICLFGLNFCEGVKGLFSWHDGLEQVLVLLGARKRVLHLTVWSRLVRVQLYLSLLALKSHRKSHKGIPLLGFLQVCELVNQRRKLGHGVGWL